MSAYDTFQDVLASLSRAALDDDLWPRAAALIDEACGLEGHGLVVGEGFGEDAVVHFGNFYYRGERRPDLEEEYFRLYHPRDERVPRLRMLPDKALVHGKDLYEEDELRTSHVYHQGLPRLRSQDGLLARLDGPDGLRIVWAPGDPAARGGWSSGQLDMAGRLLEPIRQFVNVRHSLARTRTRAASLSGLLDTTGKGIIYLDRDGRIIETNDRALELLRQPQGIFDRDGFLGTWLPRDDARLRGLLGAALPPLGGPGTAGSMAIERSRGFPRLAVQVVPVDNPDADFGARRVEALVLLTEPGRQPSVDPSVVAEVLGLTDAQGQVAVMLSEGKTVRDIAAATSRAIGTVHLHMKETYRKLGISRQTDLVRLVLSLGDLPRGDP